MVGFGTINPTDPFPGGALQKYTWSWGDGSHERFDVVRDAHIHDDRCEDGHRRAQDGYGVTTAKTPLVTVS